MELFCRELYLSKIRGFYHDSDIIKVITGVRRCGKSSLMETIKDELIVAGISEGRIIYILILIQESIEKLRLMMNLRR